jgi:hypothetical protein
VLPSLHAAVTLAARAGGLRQLANIPVGDKFRSFVRLLTIWKNGPFHFNPPTSIIHTFRPPFASDCPRQQGPALSARQVLRSGLGWLFQAVTAERARVSIWPSRPQVPRGHGIQTVPAQFEEKQESFRVSRTAIPPLHRGT